MRGLLTLVLLFPQASAAGGGKTGKALVALAAFDAGDRGQLAKAEAFSEKAVASTPDSPEAWCARGRVQLAYVLNPDLAPPGGGATAAALESFEKAVAAGAAGATHAELARNAPTLEASATAALLNDVEGKQWADASGRLELVLRIRVLVEGLGGRDADQEATMRRLAVQVTANRGDPTTARTHYDALRTVSGRHETGLAALIAKKFADKGDVAGALAFLTDIVDELPDDERLLRTQVGLLIGDGKSDQAKTSIDRGVERLQLSVSGAFLAAELYASVGAEDRARAMWEAVLALDPRHVDSMVALARSYTVLALERRKDLLARGEEASMPRPPAEVVAMIQDVEDLFARAERYLDAAAALDSQSKAVLEATIACYSAQVEGVDLATTSAATASAATDRQRLEQARAALAALEGGG